MNAQQLKNSILQEAIEGRLVPQDPNDEPASVLLEKIRKEKARLVKEGKLKKKDLEEVPIGEDEKPFEIPESWEWCRMNTIVDVRDGTHDTPSYVAQGYPLITGKDFYNGYFELSKTQFISEEDYLEICKRSRVDIGDILFSMIGGNIGSQILITEDNYFEMAIKNVALFKQYSIQVIEAKYLSYFLNARINDIKSLTLGGAQSFVSLKQLRTYLIPIPPLAEQKRIVAKIEELLPKVEEYGKAQEALDKLNEELPEQLKKSILQEAIEGRLVAQDPNDEPASVLLEKIRKEKVRLAKEGKLKKKDLVETPISEEEKPFEIPESWEWVRLGYLVDFSKSSSVKSESIEKTDWILDLEDIEKESGVLLRKKTMQESDAKSDKHIFYKGNVLYSKLRPYLNKVIIADSNGYCTSEILAFDFGLIYNKYAQLYLMSPFFVNYAMSDAYGVKMPRLGSKQGNAAVFPLPPLAEQHRIVAKIEQLMVEIDKLKM